MIAAVVLAAGLSRRMGADKLFLPLADGALLYTRVIDRASDARFGARLVVTNQPALAADCARRGFTVVPSPRAAEGMGYSVAAGVAALPEDCRGALFFNCDQPFLTGATVDALCAAFDRTDGIIVPTADGKPSAPCLFPARHFAALAACAGAQGGRSVWRAHPDEVVFVPLDPAVLRDIDCPADYEACRKE